MKKISVLILALFLGFLLVGCKGGSNEELEDLKNQVSQLQQQLINLDVSYTQVELELEGLEPTLADYRSRILSLESEKFTILDQIQTLESQKATIQARVQTLESTEAILQDQIDDLEDEVTFLDGQLDYYIASSSSDEKEIKVFLNDKYFLAPGDNFQLFFRSVIQAVNPYIYYIKLTGTVGHHYNRYFEWEPTSADAGKSFPLKLEVKDENGKVLGSATTQLVVSKANSNAPTKNILCIGDSLTSSGVWVEQGTSRYAAAGGGTINLLGTVTSSGVKHEGRGGWQWSSYVSGYGSTPSPFKATSGSGISFLDYTQRNGYSGIDELYILMTYNGVGGAFRTFNMNTEPFKSAKILIDQFHKDYPNAKITLLGIPLPSLNGGLGAYYTINQAYGDNYGQFVTVLNYNNQLKAFAKDSEYSSFMRFVDIGGQFDSEYNMPTQGKKVNNQNSTTEQVGNAMGLHPSTNGYRQIGDAFYRALCHEWEDQE